MKKNLKKMIFVFFGVLLVLCVCVHDKKYYSVEDLLNSLSGEWTHVSEMIHIEPIEDDLLLCIYKGNENHLNVAIIEKQGQTFELKNVTANSFVFETLEDIDPNQEKLIDSSVYTVNNQDYTIYWGWIFDENMSEVKVGSEVMKEIQWKSNRIVYLVLKGHMNEIV